MPVKRLSYVLLASSLLSACSSPQIMENWNSPSAWFGSDTDQQGNPVDSEKVVVARGDEDLKASVAAGNSDEATDAPLDDAISPELRAKAKDARQKLDDPKTRADASADSHSRADFPKSASVVWAQIS